MGWIYRILSFSTVFFAGSVCKFFPVKRCPRIRRVKQLKIIKSVFIRHIRVQILLYFRHRSHRESSHSREFWRDGAEGEAPRPVGCRGCTGAQRSEFPRAAGWSGRGETCRACRRCWRIDADQDGTLVAAGKVRRLLSGRGAHRSTAPCSSECPSRCAAGWRSFASCFPRKKRTPIFAALRVVSMYDQRFQVDEALQLDLRQGLSHLHSGGMGSPGRCRCWLPSRSSQSGIRYPGHKSAVNPPGSGNRRLQGPEDLCR